MSFEGFLLFLILKKRNGRVREYAVFDLIDRYFLAPGNRIGNRIN